MQIHPGTTSKAAPKHEQVDVGSVPILDSNQCS